jgi:hypothetical protein
MSRRQLILNTLEDTLSGFFYYDRKEDESLPCGEIEAALKAGEVTIEELLALFAGALIAAKARP